MRAPTQTRSLRPATQVRIGRGGHGPTHPLRTWLLRHLQAFFSTLGHLVRRPVSTLLTTAVLGIALALPSGLHVALENIRNMSSGWDVTADISLFLHQNVSLSAARTLADRVEARPDIGSVHVISPAEALAEYGRMSGLSEVIESAEQENPLPAVLVIRLEDPSASKAGLQTLITSLQGLPQVEVAQFDLRWLERLYAILRILERGTLVLAALLALAVILVVGNTIRLGIDNRREEIEIAKLFGATDAFIRRPFLWTGVLHGLAGALIAWGFVQLSIALLQGPVDALAVVYGSSFELDGLDLQDHLMLLGRGVGLGLAGSWLAVGRHLHAIEPS